METFTREKVAAACSSGGGYQNDEAKRKKKERSKEEEEDEEEALKGIEERERERERHGSTKEKIAADDSIGSTTYFFACPSFRTIQKPPQARGAEIHCYRIVPRALAR
jgi:hypothetical protein